MKPANYAPVYAGLYPELAEIARKYGYAMAVHGSFARDADLICIPWTDDASEPQAVVDAITSEFVIKNVGEPSVREHGRIVYTLTVSAPGCFIDLSFTPAIRSALYASPAPDAEPVAVACDEDSMPERIWAGDFNWRGFGHCVIGQQGGLYAEYVRADLASRPLPTKGDTNE